MDKSLDEIIAGSQAAESRKSSAATGSSSGVSKRRSAPRRSRSRGAATAQHPKTALIRNLSSEITEDDLRDLFRQVGPVIKVQIERDSRGERTGVAWVMYDFSEDALVAAERFNRRKAAGKVITVRRVARIGDHGASAGAASLSDRIGAGSRGPRRRRGKESGRSEEKARQRNRTEDDLDAELDAYMQVEQSEPLPPAAPGADTAPQEAPRAEDKPEESFIDV